MQHKDEHSPQKVFFPNLDGLRFFAFFLVYLSHALPAHISSGQTQAFLPPRLHDAVFNSAWAGVSFFFVLSGFLITYLILFEIRVTGRIDVKAFYIRRILRIWPLYYLVLLFGFVAYPLIKRLLGIPYIEEVNPLNYIFFLSNFDIIWEGRAPIFLNITWSVAIEEQFYLAWPLLFFYIPPRLFKLLFPLIIFISACFRFYYVKDYGILYFHTLSVISDMAVGGMAAYLSLRSERFTEMLARIPRWAIFILYCSGIALIVFRQDIFIGSVAGALERLVISLFFIFIVLEQNYCRHSFFKMSRLRLISRLGVYTYGLYLLHPIALTMMNYLKGLAGIGSTTWLDLAVEAIGLLMSIAMSVASYYLFEKRFLNLKRRFTHIESAQTLTQ